jgi:hypothetical protein
VLADVLLVAAPLPLLFALTPVHAFPLDEAPLPRRVLFPSIISSSLLCSLISSKPKLTH